MMAHLLRSFSRPLMAWPVPGVPSPLKEVTGCLLRMQRWINQNPPVLREISQEKQLWNDCNASQLLHLPEYGGRMCVYGTVPTSCLTLCDHMDCSPPGSSVQGILQARILEQVTISFFRESFRHRDHTCISYIGRQILYHPATREAL